MLSFSPTVSGNVSAIMWARQEFPTAILAELAVPDRPAAQAGGVEAPRGGRDGEHLKCVTGALPQAKQAQQGALCELTQLASDGAGEPKSQAHMGRPGLRPGGRLFKKIVQSGRSGSAAFRSKAIDRRVT